MGKKNISPVLIGSLILLAYVLGRLEGSENSASSNEAIDSFRDSISEIERLEHLEQLTGTQMVSICDSLDTNGSH